MAKVKITGHASGSGVITITAPNTSTDRTITLPDATDTLIGSATTDALTTRVNSSSGRKNLIINGAMKVAQRGTSFTNVANNALLLDRWKFKKDSTDQLVAGITQDSNAPSGFQSSLKIHNKHRRNSTSS